jgi:hypothetical protein
MLQSTRSQCNFRLKWLIRALWENPVYLPLMAWVNESEDFSFTLLPRVRLKEFFHSLVG